MELKKQKIILKGYNYTVDGIKRAIQLGEVNTNEMVPKTQQEMSSDYTKKNSEGCRNYIAKSKLNPPSLEQVREEVALNSKDYNTPEEEAEYRKKIKAVHEKYKSK